MTSQRIRPKMSQPPCKRLYASLCGLIGGLLLFTIGLSCDSNEANDPLDLDRDPDDVELEKRDELIDDLEDTDLRFLFADGEGRWVGHDDDEEGVLAVLTDGADETDYALRVSGTSSETTKRSPITGRVKKRR